MNFWVKICDQFFLKKWACDQFFLGLIKRFNKYEQNVNKICTKIRFVTSFSGLVTSFLKKVVSRKPRRYAVCEDCDQFSSFFSYLHDKKIYFLYNNIEKFLGFWAERYF